ncbi:MAG TPA: cyclase family protein [Streptosporangiaceae bacterium]|jgi:kynurenine formamidase
MNHNWGRWGAADERGALNLLTPDVVRAAAGAVRTGRVLSLSLPIRGATSGTAAHRVAHLRGRPLPQHFMSVDGGDYAAGARAIGAGLRVADDALVVSPHGTTTHMDALCHMWSGDELYNGHPAARVRSYGATRCGIDKALPGVVARGVLLDAAGFRGAPRLAAADRVDAATLAACAEWAGVDLRPGDVAVVRTGWPTAYDDDPELYWSGQPGLTGDAGRWLAERDVAMVACDNAAVSGLRADQSAGESGDDDLHLTLLWRHGVHIAEMLWLEDLAACDQAEFLFVAAPLAIDGGTASPINPLAVL